MAALVHRASHIPSSLVGRAWLALALVPVGWIVSLAAALAGDPQLTGVMHTADGVLVGLVALTAPTAAVILSDLADGAGEDSGRTAVALSGALLFLTIVALPRVLVSVPSFVIALALCLVALSVGLVLARRWQSRTWPEH